MFTGLIADLGELERLDANEDGATLTIATALAGEIGEGDSVAVNGVCLTAVSIDDSRFRTQAIAETLRRSTLGGLTAGAPMNLELAMRAGDRLGGHVVQGHVDGTGVLAAIRPDGFARNLDIDIEERLARYLVEKGSVAVDGVSLTVSELRDDGFTVSLIPETLQRTNLGTIEEGAQVNIEVDILAKHVERLLGATV